MGRIKGNCTIPGCKNRATSKGKRDGRPFYSTKCFFHGKKHPISKAEKQNMPADAK